MAAMTVADLIRLIEYFPKDAYVVLPNDRCAEGCYLTREKSDPADDTYVNVVRFV